MKALLILSGCVLTLTVQAEPLGRLFFTPEQRALLDTARRTMPMNAGSAAETPSAPDFSLKGIVTRSDGKRSIWVNGRVEQGVARPGAQDRNQVQIQLPSGEVKLKVGQSIDPATGQVTENYRRPPPEPAIAKPAPPKAPTPPAVSKTPAPKARDDDTENENTTTQ
jgi:hypothetical protein